MSGNQLFEISLQLLGLNESGDTDDLRSRALSLINIALAESSILDCRISRSEHRVKSIQAMTDTLDVSEIVASTVLPYALARLLILGEDDSLADSMHKLCENAKLNAIKLGKAKAEPIKEVYR